MTDQPKHADDGTPEGYQPPSYTPSQESAPPPARPAPPAELSFEKPDYEQQQTHGAQGQPTSPYPAAYGAPSQPPYARPSGQPYDQPSYSAPGQPYGQPPYLQPGGPYNAYGQPAYYGVQPEPKGLSIASLCCGVAAFVGLGFFILPQIAAVILGHLALRREPGAKGMAIAGLVLGYVALALTVLVIVIISLVASAARYTGSGA
ncbi:hypothetical protein BJG92_00558 [Arthrobacter sp. SO5]|uniref:DUF4190 domain-containing protein n=1 Tax=Arthrobacter sp. SO5 TaxID=1897055 RepID=UPI001E3660FC|nr:DUF4190 domain-containing protein [Arthrobacter sp. SO5]MCB5273046.1 hypothetical protein [Arthrobacter sp. SO5]